MTNAGKAGVVPGAGVGWVGNYFMAPGMGGRSGIVETAGQAACLMSATTKLHIPTGRSLPLTDVLVMLIAKSN
jgi:hypothetical protein